MKVKLTNFLLALALVMPATMFTALSSATAGPGSILSSANKDGKRTHKRADAKRTKKKKKKKKRSSTTRRRSSSSSTVRRTTTHRRGHTTRRHRTTRTRTVRRPARRTTNRRVVRTSPRHRHTRTRTRTRVVHTQPRTRTRTRVVHTQSSRSSAQANRSSGSSIEAYITGGLGYSGFAAPTITDDALPGAGYNVALGIKGDYIGFEFGFNGSGHTFNPEAATTDLAVFGLSGDLKLQPSFAFFEPYALAGIGGYSLQDGVIDEASGGAALRLGVGADFRFDDAAIGVRYLHSTYGFADDSGIYGGDFGANSETLGVNLSFYF